MHIGAIEKITQNFSNGNIYFKEIEKVLKLSPAELGKRSIVLFNQQINYAKSHSPFYSAALNAVNTSIKETTDIEQVPFTRKEDLRAAYPFGFLATSKSNLIRYGESTGTTGSPTSSFMTRGDWERNTAWVTLSLMNFFSADDMVFIAMPYELAFSAFDIDRAFWNIGATVVPVGTLNSNCPWSRTVKMMDIVKPSVLACSPTRALRLYDIFAECGLDPKQSKFKTLLHIGEACSQAKLRKIMKLWSTKLVTAYGTTETNTLSLPCQFGYQHLIEDRFYFEVVDPLSGQPLNSGERGELVITSLLSEALPLIRYRTGDIVTIHEEPCACGIPLRTMEHWGRYDESVTIGNRRILKIELEDVILSTEGTGCYYCYSVIGNKMKILVEVTNVYKNKIAHDIRNRLFDYYGIEAEVEHTDKTLFCRAMDKMTKPGNLTHEHIIKERGMLP